MAFKAGDHGRIGEVDWRVVTGKKGPGDLRLDLRVMEFVPVKMSLGFLLADFFVQNENVLYPRADGNEGGAMYLRFVQGACAVGWEAAQQALDEQRARAAARREVAA